MTKLLYIEASPMGEGSSSTRVAREFVTAYRRIRPNDGIDHLALWKEPLPEFGALAAHAQLSLLRGSKQTVAEAAVWQQVVAVATRFQAADKVLLSCPMWNFQLPYRMKQYLDVIIQPGLMFEWSQHQGYTPVRGGRRAQLILSRAGDYQPAAPAAPMDFQKPYLEFIFGFMGFSDVRTFSIEPTLLGGPERAEEAVFHAMRTAREASIGF